jgi:hypothetical protein
MSLYNALFGMNPAAGYLLGSLNKTDGDFGRFRDAYYEKKDDGTGRIIVYTRCGGGNRDDYEFVFNEMEVHPLYLTNYDDDFDSTYAYFEFLAPDSVNEFFKDMEAKDFEKVGDRFQREIKEMEEGKEPNEYVMNFMKGVIDHINNTKENE